MSKILIAVLVMSLPAAYAQDPRGIEGKNYAKKSIHVSEGQEAVVTASAHANARGNGNWTSVSLSINGKQCADAEKVENSTDAHTRCPIKKAGDYDLLAIAGNGNADVMSCSITVELKKYEPVK